MSSKLISVFTAAAVSLVVNFTVPIGVTAVSSVALVTAAHAGKKGTRKPKPVVTGKKCGSVGAPKCAKTKRQAKKESKRSKGSRRKGKNKNRRYGGPYLIGCTSSWSGYRIGGLCY